MIPDKPLYDSLECFDKEMVLCNRYPTFGQKTISMLFMWTRLKLKTKIKTSLKQFKIIYLIHFEQFVRFVQYSIWMRYEIELVLINEGIPGKEIVGKREIPIWYFPNIFFVWFVQNELFINVQISIWKHGPSADDFIIIKSGEISTKTAMNP